jgi:hypothetical protein
MPLDGAVSLFMFNVAMLMFALMFFLGGALAGWGRSLCITPGVGGRWFVPAFTALVWGRRTAICCASGRRGFGGCCGSTVLLGGILAESMAGGDSTKAGFK